MELRFDHITKSFGAAPVLKEINLSISTGQIFALLGENGAGKSTLMNILGGLLAATSGQVFLDGTPARLRTPAEALAQGIAFIHQELNPVNDLTIYENIFLGCELHSPWGTLKRNAMRAEAAGLLEQLGVDLPADTMMDKLDAAHKQIVEIARALHHDARILIMDEPTTSLTEHEIQRVFQVVRRLSSQGVTIIFISHKLNEVIELCSDYAVLRNGVLVAQGAIADTTAEELSDEIVGHELVSWQNTQKEGLATNGPELLRVEDLCRLPAVKGISFSIRKGEILGFTGLLGDGRSELFRCIFGDTPDYTGKVFLHGKPFHAKNTTQAIRAGIACLPSNRKENAIVPDMHIRTNSTLATLGKYATMCFVSTTRQRQAFLEGAKAFSLKFASDSDLITSLSGGNQQKVVLSRWLDTHPSILVLDNPTQGVDIGAKQEIYSLIRQIAASGVAVALLSGESQEIIRLCHRVIVLFHGEAVGELQGEAMTEQAIMELATGAGKISSNAFNCIA